MIKESWYKNAAIYSLSVGSCMDADRDRIGDLEGSARRVDYIQSLGVTTTWLMRAGQSA
jgi:maltose alpha-D-glucosyltransferase/alpha-amylase